MEVGYLIFLVLFKLGWGMNFSNETSQCKGDNPNNRMFLESFKLPEPENIVVPARLKQIEVKDGRIINGENAEKNQFPWQVRLITYSYFGSAICGGAIISERFVLTACHCVDPGDFVWYVTIQYGSNFVNEMQTINTTSIFPHPKFNRSLLENDIALIKLPCQKQFIFTESVKAVALPREHLCEDWVGSVATVSGFGLYLSDNQTLVIAPRLKFVKMIMQSNIDCLRIYGPFMRPNNLCATGFSPDQSQGTCRGDSGGPLVVYVYGQPVLVGLVSYGNKTCLNQPNGFTRVAAYDKWINSIMYA